MNSTLALILQLGCALFWVLAYILIILRSFKDKSYGMPLVALCANISWEFIFSFILPLPAPQRYIVILWFGLDLIILLQFLLFGKSNFIEGFYKKIFYPLFLLTLISSFLTILLITQEFKDYIGMYTAFGQNLLMSVLFINLLVRRNSTEGQSIAIAISKLIGTLFAAILFYLYQRSALIIFFSMLTLFFDLAYIIILYNAKKIFQTK